MTVQYNDSYCKLTLGDQYREMSDILAVTIGDLSQIFWKNPLGK